MGGSNSTELKWGDKMNDGNKKRREEKGGVYGQCEREEGREGGRKGK